MVCTGRGKHHNEDNIDKGKIHNGDMVDPEDRKEVVPGVTASIR